MLPNTVLTWSQLFQRLRWRSTQNCKAMNFAALRINSFAAARVFSIGGYIRYPEIGWCESGILLTMGFTCPGWGMICNFQTELYTYLFYIYANSLLLILCYFYYLKYICMTTFPLFRSLFGGDLNQQGFNG